MELEETLNALEAARQKLVQLNEAKQVWETQIALEVSRDRQYGNDMLRKAEIARRLKETPEVQDLDRAMASTKAEVAGLEIKAERIKWELRNTQALLQLAAAAVQAGNQEVLGLLVGQQEAEHEVKEKQEAAKNNGLVEMTVRVLGAMPGKKEGVVKALVQDGKGNKFEVYGNGQNGVARKLAKSINEALKLRCRKLNHGWFAVEVVQ